MSFVGPRPDVPGYADKLTGEDRDVLKLRPGITGPATLKYRLEDEYLANARELVSKLNVNLDLDYNANLDLDDNANLDLDVNLDEKLKRKAEKLLSFILSSGSKHKVRDTFVLAKIFPYNTIKFLPSIFLNVNGSKVMERVRGCKV